MYLNFCIGLVSILAYFPPLLWAQVKIKTETLAALMHSQWLQIDSGVWSHFKLCWGLSGPSGLRSCSFCFFLFFAPSGFTDPAVHASTGHSADNKHVWCWLLLGCKVPTKPPRSGCWGAHPCRLPRIPHDLISALWFSTLVYCIGTTFILNCNQLAQKNRTQ